MVLIPIAGAVIPLHEGGTDPEPGDPQPPPVCAPTSEIEEALNLSRPARRQVQAGLGATGHATGTIDGMLGPRTRAAIREWQQTQTNCTATGFLNQRQADSLMALAPPGPDDPPEPPPPVTETARSRVVIEAEPGSEIAIDNDAVGTTSEIGTLAVDGILAGEHVLTASRPGFEPIRRTIEVVAGISQVVSLTFQPLPGRLTVTANVDNAYVEIDTGYSAFAPVTEVEVNAGTRQITVSSPGYEPDQQLVTVPPDGAVTHHATLEPFPVEEFTDQIERVFSSGAYEEVANTAGNLVRVLDSWIATGVDIDPDVLSRALTIEGRSLFELSQFQAATVPLYRAILAGGRVELPVKHRHGGGGLRPSFCRGTLSLSLNEIRFESVDDPDHGFAVPPSSITNVERAGARNGFLFRVNTEVDGRGDMDFVHPNAERQRRDPDSGLQIDLTCPDCNQALEVHAALLLRLSEHHERRTSGGSERVPVPGQHRGRRTGRHGLRPPERRTAAPGPRQRAPDRPDLPRLQPSPGGARRSPAAALRVVTGFDDTTHCGIPMHKMEGMASEPPHPGLDSRMHATRSWRLEPHDNGRGEDVVQRPSSGIHNHPEPATAQET